MIDLDDAADDREPYDAALYLLRSLNGTDEPETVALTLGAAQVHATLALTDAVQRVGQILRRQEVQQQRDRLKR